MTRRQVTTCDQCGKELGLWGAVTMTVPHPKFSGKGVGLALDFCDLACAAAWIKEQLCQGADESRGVAHAGQRGGG